MQVAVNANPSGILSQEGRKLEYSHFLTLKGKAMFDILALAPRIRQWNGAVHYAAELANMLEGSLNGIHVVEPLLTMSGVDSPVLISDAVAYLQEHIKTAQDVAPSFMAWADEMGVGHAQWRATQSNLLPALSYAAHWHDVLVLDSNLESSVATGEIVISSQIPCIIVPDNVESAQLRCIALAWKGTVESIRAIHAAFPLLRHAEKLVLLHAEHSQPLSAMNWKPAFEIHEYLDRHGFSVIEHDTKIPEEGAGESLLKAAEQVGADLLVMGAYGRNRFSEWMFGGATRQVLQHSRIPLFMRH